MTLATGLNHALSIVVGRFIGNSLSPESLALLVGTAFIVFGLWTIRGNTLDDDVPQRREAAVVAIAFMAFFLAELGDKTMFATMALATQYGPVGTWLGSTAGMVAADALAIMAGGWLLSRVSGRQVQLGSAMLFFAYGGFKVYTGVSGLVSLPPQDWVLIGLVVALIATVYLHLRERMVRRANLVAEISASVLLAEDS